MNQLLDGTKPPGAMLVLADGTRLEVRGRSVLVRGLAIVAAGLVSGLLVGNFGYALDGMVPLSTSLDRLGFPGYAF